MLRSMYSGISGLRSHQTMLDVVGNNIANVNTAGFKTSQVVFQDTLSQLIRAAGAPQGNGGVTPAQVGLGVRVADITTNFGQGSAQVTGRSSDMMIQGDGFFVVRDGGEELYTRAGTFNFDRDGRMVTPQGLVVQGWMADPFGTVNTNGTIGDIVLPVDTLMRPEGTTEASFGGNLPSDAVTGDRGTDTWPAGSRIVSSITGHTTDGTERQVVAVFTHELVGGVPTWQVALSDDLATPGTAVPITWDATTGYATNTPASLTVAAGGAEEPAIEVDIRKLTNFAGPQSAKALAQNGQAMGEMQSFQLSPDGTIVGIFSNGLKLPLGQMAMANFNNPPGMEKVGGSMLRASVDSGIAQIGTAGTGGRGALSAGSLEMSNVDLAQEFTNLIVAQRGFQANSRIITASDEVLQDLVNIKR